MINRINGVLNEGGISFYREDLNTGSIRDSWRQAESADPDRSGMIENGYVQGHYALWDGILANENIKMIDSCASGGHRLELESMRRAVALHATDYNLQRYARKTSEHIRSRFLAALRRSRATLAPAETSPIPANIICVRHTASR